MVANQTDVTTNLTKNVEEIGTKTQNADTEFNAVKSEIENLKLQVTRQQQQSSSSSASGTGLLSNDKFNQMFEALERQLGIYDVRIAEMDLRFQVIETTNYNGCLIWRIQDYHRRKEDAKRGRTLSLYSQPFYTSKYGYKMCARIYLNGDGMGKGSHVSIFFVVMKGEYDALLPWPFRQKVTMMCLDQGAERRHLVDTFRPDPNSTSFKRPTSDMNIASGCPLFAAHAVIEGSSYIQEDVLFIRIIVDTSDLENF